MGVGRGLGNGLGSGPTERRGHGRLGRVRRLCGKVIDEEPRWSRGARSPSAAVGCAPAPDLSKQSTGLRSHLFQINPRGRVLVRPSPVE
jgi:hypothetical protein